MWARPTVTTEQGNDIWARPTQIRRNAAPSVSLIMPATGAVWPRKKVAVAEAIISGSEAHAVLPIQPACHIKLATLVAKAIMLTLNTICCGLNLASRLGQVCSIVETHAIAAASAALRFTTASSRNGMLTDMFPLTPGSLTFIRDVAAASANIASAEY